MIAKHSTIHKFATIAWSILIVPTLLYWSASIEWVVFMSLYANIAGHLSAYEGAIGKESSEEMNTEPGNELKLKAFMETLEIIKSGYAGIQRNTGLIVDRRIEPNATPVQENASLNAPAPKEVKVCPHCDKVIRRAFTLANICFECDETGHSDKFTETCSKCDEIKKGEKQ